MSNYLGEPYRNPMLKFFFLSALQFGERPAAADASSCSSAAGGQPSSCLARLWGKQAELQSCFEFPATRQRLQIQTGERIKQILHAVHFFTVSAPSNSNGQKTVNSSEAPPTTSHSDESWLKRSERSWKGLFNKTNPLCSFEQSIQS